MDKTLAEAGRLLAQAESIVIATHLMPDGDGLGAAIALYHYLNRLGKKVRIVNPDGVPERYMFLDKGRVIEVLNDDHFKKPLKCDLAVVVDTNDPKRLGRVWELFTKNAKDILFLDHHPYNDEPHPELAQLHIHTVVDVKSSSIGEMLYRLFHNAHDLLDTHTSTFTLSPEIALGLYVSIITDTNSFRYSRTTALSHRIAADLIDFGLQPEEIYQNIFSTKSIDHLRLIGEVLSKVDEVPSLLNHGRTIAWVEITKDLRKRYGATSDDTQSIVNFLLLLKNAEVLILFREEDDGRIKVSIKSKGTIKVSGIAQEFGGGGHEFAAGFATKGKMSEVRTKLLKRFSK